MNVYLDTSALIKLYVKEEGHEKVRKAAAKATVLASHHIAYVEMRAAFARLLRMDRVTKKQFESFKSAFKSEWPAFMRIQTTDILLTRAGELAERFGLRAFDSVHLAASEFLALHVGQPIVFGCFDRALNEAAEELEFTLL